MNILVTGGCGFIGSNFINHMMTKHLDIMIVNLDNMYYCSSIYNIDESVKENKNYKFIKGDICSRDIVNFILTNYKITHVIHFAAQTHVQNSFEDSLAFTKDNVLGTHVLLEACRKYNKLKKFIHVSTDEVYGESQLHDNECKNEASILCPTNPYAASKAAAEMIIYSYISSFNMPIVVTRGNNIYGRNQYPEKVIPLFVKLLRDRKKITIQGDGSCLRAFLNVTDAVSAFEIILFKGELREIYNIGCDEGMEYSILDIGKMLIRKIIKTTDYDDWIEYIEDRPFNDKRYYISNEKIKSLGWKVSTSFEKGIDDYLSQPFQKKKDSSYCNIIENELKEAKAEADAFQQLIDKAITSSTNC